jgi:hypothetical protein
MKKTPWFSGLTKPSRIGVYERRTELRPTNGDYWPYSFWDGHKWGLGSPNPEGAAVERRRQHHHAYQNFEWRGLAEEPK